MINGISLLNDSTGLVPSGGVATPYDSDGADIPNGIHVVDNTTETNFLLRNHITFKNRAHSQQPNGGFSKGIRSFVLTMPILLADGTISYQVSRVSTEIHPEMVAAQILEHRLLTAQCIIDAELDDFYAYGVIK